MRSGDITQQPLVSVENLQATFFTKAGAIRAVDDISYSIAKGKTLGIVGESGCGKSVASYAMMRLLDHPGKVTAGRAFVDGIDILSLDDRRMEDLRGSKMAMIFQEPMTALNPVYTIGFQMDEQIMKHLKVTPAGSKERAVSFLNMVGIPSPIERYSCYPHQLSGGMRQRAMIAMALSCEPNFLIADEPTTALDVTIQAQILDLIQRMQEQFKMTVQFITHDLGVISEMADEVMVMYAGRTVETASAQELFSQPRHPYTRALLHSLPKFRHRVDRLETIRGSVPAPLERPRGCNFQNRCLFASDACKETPPLIEVSANHKVACFNLDKIG